MKRSLFLLPAAAAVLLLTDACSFNDELPLPPGAYQPGRTSGLNGRRRAKQADETPIELITPRLPGEEMDIVLTPGETVLVLSPVEKLAPIDDITGSDLALTPAEPKTPEKFEVYTVQKGDTLGKIAYKHKTTAVAIADYNRIDIKSVIRPGQTLEIPVGTVVAAAPKTTTGSAPTAPTAKPSGKTASIAISDGDEYVVQSGDSLGRIASRHGIRTADLASANNLDAKKPIFPGQKLVIPKSGTSIAAPAHTASNTGERGMSSAKPPIEKKTDVEPAPDFGFSNQPVINETFGETSDTITEPIDAPSETETDVELTRFDITLSSDMTISEIATMYGRTTDEIKRMNPQLKAGEKIKSGTIVYLPLIAD